MTAPDDALLAMLLETLRAHGRLSVDALLAEHGLRPVGALGRLLGGGEGARVLRVLRRARAAGLVEESAGGLSLTPAGAAFSEQVYAGLVVDALQEAAADELAVTLAAALARRGGTADVAALFPETVPRVAFPPGAIGAAQRRAWARLAPATFERAVGRAAALGWVRVDASRVNLTEKGAAEAPVYFDHHR